MVPNHALYQLSYTRINQDGVLNSIHLSYTPSLLTVVNKVFGWSSWTRTNNLCFPIQIKHLVCCIRLIFIYKIFIFLNYLDRIYLILLYLLSYSSNQLRLSLIRLELTTHILIPFYFCCYCHIILKKSKNFFFLICKFFKCCFSYIFFMAIITN